jgi:hypothetical protein
MRRKAFSPLSTQSSQRKTVNYSTCYLSVLRDLCGKYEAVNILVICVYLRPK